MSYGGDFYALSDDQLTRILSGQLDGEAFLRNGLPERPADCFTGGEAVWHELTKLLGPENACGVDITDAVPVGGGCSASADVQRTAEALTVLTKDELRHRYAVLDTRESFESLYAVVLGLVSFYRRAGKAGHAVLFNIC
ncbi:DUF1877 family protein [Ideonella sp. A 288]|uniref:DUF1877 family protein n=1 Tax=Ideonella sp. A 288 TaxID=1962181 RepID=UPI001186AFDE|nr:DUF1877 family protein [Ideonella sp. A 288]